MAKVMIVGAGGVGSVVAHKCNSQPEFTEILLTSRTIEKCNKIAQSLNSPKISTAALNADVVEDTVKLLKEFHR